MKISKAAKARLRLMSASDRKAVEKAARVLADAECVSYARANAIIRWVKKGGC